MGEVIGDWEGRESLETRRLLTEVDHLLAHRRAGSYDPQALADLLGNLTSAVQEAAQPYAVTPTFRERVGNEYMWMGQTSVEVAESGARWYKSAAAGKRLLIEVDEAHDKPRPGMVKVFLSPRMTADDAPREVAAADHLEADDAIRTSYLVERDGEIIGMQLHSLLVSDVPLDAWVALLNDPNGLFGNVMVPPANSALPVMEAHRFMHVPFHVIPEGPISLIEAAIPYIKDVAIRERVMHHLVMFRSVDQQAAYTQAEAVALRWRAFEVELANSLVAGYATPAIRTFIGAIGDRLSQDAAAVLDSATRQHGHIAMDRELAAVLEAARRNTLWVAAAVMAGNETVLCQMPGEVADRIRKAEIVLQMALQSGYTFAHLLGLEGEQSRMVAEQNISVGRACAGKLEDLFRSSKSKDGTDSPNGRSNENTEGTGEDGVCDYRHTGCYCCPYDMMGRPLGRRLVVTARRSADGTARCLRLGCGAKLAADGTVLSKGKIFAKAEANRLAAEGVTKRDLVLAG